MDDRKHRYDINKLGKRLRRDVGRAIGDYGLIEDGDRVMVCLSGGKDSYTLLDILLSLKRAAPIDFELVAVNLDQKQPGFPEDVLPRYLDALGVPYHILERDTYSIVQRLTPEGKTFCPVCSRLRRGLLYGFASEIGATKVALGHHLDDVVETLFLNMFFGGRLKAMPPKLKSDDGRNILIRPLYYCRETDIARWASTARTRSSRATCADRRRTCSGASSKTCSRNGTRQSRVASRTSPAASPTSAPRRWPIRSCSISLVCSATRRAATLIPLRARPELTS